MIDSGPYALLLLAASGSPMRQDLLAAPAETSLAIAHDSQQLSTAIRQRPSGFDAIVIDAHAPVTTNEQIIAVLDGAPPSPVIVVAPAEDPDLSALASRTGGALLRTAGGAGDVAVLRRLLLAARERRQLERYRSAVERLSLRVQHSGGVELKTRELVHDLLNALTPTRLSAAIGKRTEDARARSLFEEIEAGLEASFSMINEIQGLSSRRRVDAFLPERFVRADLAVFLAERLKPVRRLIPGSVRFSVDTQAASGTSVYIEEAPLIHVLCQLVENAVQALSGQPDGAIGIRLERVTRPAPDGAEARGAPLEHLELRISDNGPGIEPATLPHVFEPLYSGWKEGRGQGLGLLACRALMHRLGGEVEIASEPGRGTDLRLLLPVLPPLGIEEENSGAKALVVGSESPALPLARHLLESTGWAVLVAEDAERGRHIRAAEEAFHLVLVDELDHHPDRQDFCREILAAPRPPPVRGVVWDLERLSFVDPGVVPIHHSLLAREVAAFVASASGLPS